MGQYFVMSRHFNRKSAADFGLLEKDSAHAISPKDHSLWVKAPLYDFGWGKEDGYFRQPLPDFSGLLQLVLHSDDEEDFYGAAAILLDRYPDEILCTCEAFLKNSAEKENLKKISDILCLSLPVNRSPILHQSLSQISENYERWQQLAKQVSSLF